jgi:transcriptional regulator with XRE-family HTH domain
VIYLSRKQVAERIGVTPGALSRYNLPDPDVTVGTNPGVRGWLPATIDAWQAARPGRGARTDLHGATQPVAPAGRGRTP